MYFLKPFELLFPGNTEQLVSIPYDYEKRANVFRGHTRGGQFLFETHQSQEMSTWMEYLTIYPPLILDCTHFLSTDQSLAFQRFHERTIVVSPKGTG